MKKTIFLSISLFPAWAGAVPLCTDADAVHIDEVSELSQINTVDAPIFCLDADVFSSELIQITQAGSQGNKRYLRGNGYTIRHLKVDAPHWVIANMTVDRNGESGAVRLRADDIKLQNVDVTDSDSHLIIAEGEGIKIKNSTLGPTRKKPDTDHHCVQVKYQSDDFLLENNVIYNCAGDCLQVSEVGGDPETQPAGLDLLDNECYVTSAYYTPEGLACAEDGFEFKAGTDILIDNNELYGFRQTDDSCGGTGGPGRGISFIEESNTATISNNTIYDTPQCFKAVYNPPKHVTYDIDYQSNNSCTEL